RINKVTIRNQKTRWGSCSARGNLSFNFNLVRYRKEIIDYVIVHELCHLKEMNHSNKFWNLVEKICPDYKALRRELKKGSNIQ
ncbi:MAG: M48 family metallopeptidase, partial [Ignavibacteriaceae bacterium]|nr:M48 family metallopeptidase [Ignavibacteriaceae bacterium]